MLFLVISTPRPDKPTSLTNDRMKYWDWMNPLLASGVAKSAYPRVGRGVAVTFNVDSNETLHRLMNEWADIIPAHFEVYPLLDAGVAKQFLASQAAS
ncbi:hypothetical protein BCM14_0359 [Jezberella montanilacus]|jgi:hypothetical protein|uniref:Muconolactone isomerase domain-containing protein n=1 Tax=Jezberella montanilacus TaxID=323426 RepID=A0A2T0XJ30_9BURK|nr:DUF3303 family protein [Jezberella montanilacus]PRY98922.1 hypothetical protein BCM14_0359 [Jezberella montanilacus]